MQHKTDQYNTGLTGDQVKAIRTILRISQTKFAELLNLNQPAISDMEKAVMVAERHERKIAEIFPAEYFLIKDNSIEKGPAPLSAEEVRQIRSLTGLSQEGFGQRLGITQAAVNNAEHRGHASMKLTGDIWMTFREEYKMVRPIRGQRAEELDRQRRCYSVMRAEA